MNRNIVLLRKVTGLSISVGSDSEFEPYVKVGDQVKVGDNLFKIEGMKIEESHYLPDEIDVKKENAKDYICRLESEYITKGEVIAEKFMASGLTSKRVLAGKDGILSFDRIEKGYLDIFSEEEVRMFKSPISGQITFIDPMDHIEIEPDTVELVPFTSKIEELQVRKDSIVKPYYDFVFVKDGSSIYTVNDLSGDYHDKVVFVGQYLHAQLARKLVELGCRAIVTFSMDYEDFKDFAGTVFVIAGFGHIQMDKKFLTLFKSFEGNYVCINEKFGNSLGIINPVFKWPFSDATSEYGVPELTSEVVSIDIASFMQVGNLEAFEQNGEYGLVDFGKNGRHLIKTENLRNIVLA